MDLQESLRRTGRVMPPSFVWVRCVICQHRMLWFSARVSVTICCDCTNMLSRGSSSWRYVVR